MPKICQIMRIFLFEVKKTGDSILVENKRTLSKMGKSARFRDLFVRWHYKCFCDIYYNSALPVNMKRRIVFKMQTFSKHETKLWDFFNSR